MSDLTTYLERGLEIEVEGENAFYAEYERTNGEAEATRALGDMIHAVSRKLLAVTNPVADGNHIRALVIPHEEAGTTAQAMQELPERVSWTRKAGGVYASVGGKKPEIPTETLTYTLYAIRPTETPVTYDEALRGR